MADYMYPPRPPRSSRYDDYDRDDYMRAPRKPGADYQRPRPPPFNRDSDYRGFREPYGERRSVHRRESPPDDYRPRRRARSHDREPLPAPRRPRSPPRSQHQRPRNIRRQSSSMDAPRRKPHSPPPRRSLSVVDTFKSEKVQHATKAAFDAAAVEAIRLRKQPGQWTGQKGRRIATAALGAATTDTIAGKARDGDQGDSKRHLIESTIGGLIANRAINGSMEHDLHKSKGRSSGRDHERDHGRDYGRDRDRDQRRRR